MKFKDVKRIIKEDFLAYNSSNIMLVEYLKNPGFKLTVWMRLCKYFSHKKINLVLYFSFLFQETSFFL